MLIYLVVQKDTEYGSLIEEVIGAYTNENIAENTANTFNQSKNEFDGEYVVNSVFLSVTHIDDSTGDKLEIDLDID